MLKNNKFNMVLAVIAAIVLWAYVLGEINPPSDAVVKDVSISFANEETLTEEGLTLLSSSHTTVNISISGQRSAVTQVKKSDFSVVADLEALPVGESMVRLNISGPDDVKIEGVDTEKIAVIIDKVVQEEKAISVVVTGEAQGNKEAHILQVGKNSEIISGPKTIVDTVESLAAYVDVAEIKDHVTELKCELVPVNQAGKKVEGVVVRESSQVNVKAILLTTKTVSLETAVINGEREGVDIKYTAPKSIVIKGAETILAGISRVTCDAIDLKDVTEDVSIPLVVNLPEGVQLANAYKNIVMTVTVKSNDNVTKTFELNRENIQLSGQEEGLSYTISETTIEIEVSGKESEISNLKEEDFVIAADVTGLERGTHKVPISVAGEKENLITKVVPEEIEITIE